MRFNSVGAVSPAAALRPSAMIAILAAVVAVYLTIAVYYAVFEAVSFGETQLWVAAAAALLVLGIAGQINWRFGLILVLALSFVAQLVWVSPIGLAMEGEPAFFWQDARGFARSLDSGEAGDALAKLHESNYPSALIVYGFAAFLFKLNVSTVQVLTAAVWTVQTWLVWKIASEVSEIRPRAFACALIFGLSPTTIVFGGLPSVEALYGLFVLGAFYVMLSHRKRGLALSAALSGGLVALAFLARPSGVGYLVGLIAVLAVGFAYAGNWIQRGRMVGAILACVLGFAVGVAPQLALNYNLEGRLSIAPGMAIGEEMLTGTDPSFAPGEALRAHEDRIAELAASLNAPDSAAARRRAEDLVARDIAIERIGDSPLGFAAFALTEKMSLLWSSEQPILQLTLRSQEAEQTVISGPIGKAMPSIVGGWYLAMLIAAAAGALRLCLRGGAVRDPTRWVLVFMAFISLAGAAALGKADPMRHLAFTPLLALLAPLPFARLPQVAGMSMRARIIAAAEGAEDRAPAAPAKSPSPIAAAPKKPAPAATPPVAAPSPAVAATPKPAAPAVAMAAGAVAEAPAKPVEEWSPEQKLAHVLRSMSKPPRPPEEDGGGEATAESA